MTWEVCPIRRHRCSEPTAGTSLMVSDGVVDSRAGFAKEAEDEGSDCAECR